MELVRLGAKEGDMKAISHLFLGVRKRSDYKVYLVKKKKEK